MKKEPNKCVTSRKFRSVASPALPEIRVTESQPFRVTGVDSRVAIRVIHLEIVEDQTTTSFLGPLGDSKAEEEFRNSSSRIMQAGSQVLTTFKSHILNTPEPLTEVEATLISHPLIYMYKDINDGPPLTPSQFLFGQEQSSVNFARYSR